MELGDSGGPEEREQHFQQVIRRDDNFATSRDQDILIPWIEVRIKMLKSLKVDKANREDSEVPFEFGKGSAKKRVTVLGKGCR
jgi:hypothetical protein